MNTATKERPIFFSTPMVKAILDGRKRMTRRIVKLDAELRKRNGDLNKALVDPGGSLWGPGPYLKVPCATDIDGSDDGGTVQRVHCPFGYPEYGDRLWVKEAFLLLHSGRTAAYRADMDPVEASGFGAMYGGWKPSIRMPRKFSRITLELTSIRVERLQEISEADAQAEGCRRPILQEGPDFGNGMRGRPMTGNYVDAFRTLWESINGKGSWAANPFCWILEFRTLAHPFTCPNCGGHCFGVVNLGKADEYVRCDNATDGTPLSEDWEAFVARVEAGGESKKACGWRGKWEQSS